MPVSVAEMALLNEIVGGQLGWKFCTHCWGYADHTHRYHQRWTWCDIARCRITGKLAYVVPAPQLPRSSHQRILEVELNGVTAAVLRNYEDLDFVATGEKAKRIYQRFRQNWIPFRVYNTPTSGGDREYHTSDRTGFVTEWKPVVLWRDHE